MRETPSIPQRLFAEALGTGFLLAAVVGSGIMAQRLSGGNAALALLCNTLPTGAILTVLILTFGPLSGAHFNPAVSVAFSLRGELPWPEMAAYIVAQIIGAMIGVGAAHLMFELLNERVQGNRSRNLSRRSDCCSPSSGAYRAHRRPSLIMRSGFTSPRPTGLRLPRLLLIQL